MNRRAGQIGIGALTIIGGFIFASMSLAWNAVTKADHAIEKASAVEVDVREIKTDVRWIREVLASRGTAIVLSSSSQPINGHR